MSECSVVVEYDAPEPAVVESVAELDALLDRMDAVAREREWPSVVRLRPIARGWHDAGVLRFGVGRDRTFLSYDSTYPVASADGSPEPWWCAGRWRLEPGPGVRLWDARAVAREFLLSEGARPTSITWSDPDAEPGLAIPRQRSVAGATSPRGLERLDELGELGELGG